MDNSYFFGGEKCGNFVEKWKGIYGNVKIKIHKYKKQMYKNKKEKIYTEFINIVDKSVHQGVDKLSKRG